MLCAYAQQRANDGTIEFVAPESAEIRYPHACPLASQYAERLSHLRASLSKGTF